MSTEESARYGRPAGKKPPTNRFRPLYAHSWAVVIGITKYGSKQRSLTNARHDAEAVAELLQGMDFDVYTLYDEQATRDGIMSYLEDVLPDKVEPNDRLIFFFAGHGDTRQDGKKGYLIPYNAAAYSQYVDMTALRDAFGLIKAKHILVLLDSCFSGILTVLNRSSVTDSSEELDDARLTAITSRQARQILAAGGSDETVADTGVRPGHSAFTDVLLRGLRDREADKNNDGLITAIDLFTYIEEYVPRETAGPGRIAQTPVYGTFGGTGEGNFVFAFEQRLTAEQASRKYEELASLVETKNLASALQKWEKFREIAPDFSDKYNLAERFARFQQATKLYEQMTRLSINQSWRKAVDIWSEIVAIEPDFVDDRKLLNQAQSALRNMDENQRFRDTARAEADKLYSDMTILVTQENWVLADEKRKEINDIDRDYPDPNHLFARIAIELQRLETKKRQEQLRKLLDMSYDEVARLCGNGEWGKAKQKWEEIRRSDATYPDSQYLVPKIDFNLEEESKTKPDQKTPSKGFSWKSCLLG